MMNVISHIRRIVTVFKKKYIWNSQFRTIENKHIPSTVKQFKGMGKILIIAPHADDELIGCHQLIINNANRVTVFYCSLLGSNYSEGNKNIREKEFRKCIKHYACDMIISSRENLKGDLNKAIAKLKPEYVFLPSYIDWQTEHRYVNDILFNVKHSLDEAKIGWYHVSLPIPANRINAFSAMSKSDEKEKWELMKKCYLSQLHMDLDRFEYIEQCIYSGYYALETYILLSLSEWELAMRMLEGKQHDLNDLKNTLGNIENMFIKSEELYSQMF